MKGYAPCLSKSVAIGVQTAVQRSDSVVVASVKIKERIEKEDGA